MKNILIKLRKKYSILYFLALFFILNNLIFYKEVRAEIIYEYKTENIITKGAKYEHIRRITDKGFLDIHVLRADVKDNNIKILPIQSDIYGKKETTSFLLKNKGALAGINGDYFDMNKDIVTSMGAIVSDGKIISISDEKEGYATFFMDDSNNPFIEYLQPNIIFKNNGETNIKIHAINKYYNNFSAVYFDKQAIENTSELDSKFVDLVKFVVEDGIITYISKGGETVEVPEKGYILVVAATYAQYFYDSVRVGDSAEISIESKFNFNKIKMAIGGAGKIVENGCYSNYGYVVSPMKRNPRSAIGINKDGTEVILVAVDGRKDSIGVTHKEMADILISLGIYNGMHLDGGGSTTMAVKTLNDNSLKVVNNVSDGVERKIVNAIGIFNNEPLGDISSLEIKTDNDKLFYGNFIDVHIYGLDNNLNKIEISDNIVYNSDDIESIWDKNIFYPKKIGKINIQVSFNGINANKTIECLKLAELNSETKYIKIFKGDHVKLKFNGISTNGYMAPVRDLKYEIVPSNLGVVENDSFIARENGTGYIKVMFQDIVTYIGVSVGTLQEEIISFSENDKVNFIASSPSVKGNVSYESVKNNKGDKGALVLKYKFDVSDNKQAAYINFNDNLKIKNDPIGIKMSIYGDNSNNCIGMKIVDAKGKKTLVDITKQINWRGWKELKILFPKNVVYPLEIDSLYVKSKDNNKKILNSIYFSNLMVIYSIFEEELNLPPSSHYDNPFNVSLCELEESDGSFDITMVGNVVLNINEKPANYRDIQKIALNNFIKKSSLGVFACYTDIDNIGKFNIKKWTEEYKFELFNNVALINLNSKLAGLTSTSVYNWSFINESKNSKADHIIIQIDKLSNLMKSKIDLEMFEEGLKEIYKTGKNIFIVSTDGILTTTNVKNGITYINLGSLFKSDCSVNNEFSILRFRIKNNEIKFDIQKN